ncbi:YvrJ family protein [Shouchella shacheensis]|uniref:YvrJ family protein n=1 Tax=Shouchella shacheensis TaxID=1649580 RepID=UPI0009EAB441|nr:YvrJ family protein [Shouchella shacheensis]
MEHLPNWVIFLGNFGFPTLVAMYLLVRFERKIDNLTQAIQKLERTKHQSEE